MFRKSIFFTVNSQLVELSGKSALAPFSDTLRYLLRKTGTKVVCAEGDCGACTVMLARTKGDLKFRSMNSCILPTFLADGCHIVTVEGLANHEGLHEIQKSMIRNFGGQCGFCTPGFVMSIANMYEHKEAPNEQNIKNYLTGNLCRCTGYQPIINAAKDVENNKLQSIATLYPLKEETKALLDKTKYSLLIESEEKTFFAPSTLNEAIQFKSEHPGLRIFSGATDIGVQINKGRDAGHVQMSLHLIDELYEISQENGQIHVGARVNLDSLQKYLESRIPEFSQFLNIFASPQIKNSATLIGNLANGSPIADTTPFLMCLDAEVELIGSSGIRKKAIPEFFKAYKTFDMKEDEFIKSVCFSVPEDSCIGLYKTSQRRDLDIACVNAGFIFKVKDEKVESARMAYGGIAPTPLRLKSVELLLNGMKLDRAFIPKVQKLISDEVHPISDVRGTADFRRLMALKLFERFCVEKLGL